MTKKKEMELIDRLNYLREEREKMRRNLNLPRYSLKEETTCEGHGMFYGTGKFRIERTNPPKLDIDKEIERLEKKLMNYWRKR